MKTKQGDNTRISLAFNVFIKGTISKNKDLTELILQLNIETRFSIHLDNILWPTETQKNTEQWNISGRRYQRWIQDPFLYWYSRLS